MVDALRQGQSVESHIPQIPAFVAHLMIRTKHVRSGMRSASQIFFDKTQENIGKGSRQRFKNQVKKALRKELRGGKFGELMKQLPKIQQRKAKEILKKTLREIDVRPYLADAFRDVRQDIDLVQLTTGAHLKVLSQNIVPQPRVDRMAHLRWELIRRSRRTFILGDSVVIGAFQGVEGLHSLFNVIGPIELVIVPLSDSLCVAGRSTVEITLPDPGQINLASAEVSREFFVASQASEQEIGYHHRLGTRADIISERDVSEALRDL